MSSFIKKNKLCLLGDLYTKVDEIEARGIIEPFEVNTKIVNVENFLKLYAAWVIIKIIGNMWSYQEKY